MDFKQLQTFYIVSKELNFTKAAQQLGYTQSCVTLHIQKLEEELGVPLFERIGKKVFLSDAGKNLLPTTMQLLKMTQNLKDITQKNSLETGSIRIGICDSLCIEKMPLIIKSFKHQYPNVDIYLKILKCSEFINELRENNIDLAYTIGYLNKIPEIQYCAEVTETICVLAAPDFPLTLKKNLYTKDFDGIPFILTESASYYRKNFLAELEQSAITPKIILETESIQAIKNLTESGLGVCILPQVAANAEIKAGKLVCLDYTCDYGIQSQLIWHRDKWLSPILNEFINITKEVASQFCQTTMNSNVK
jgi:DNA-binding transcriptional LysR family regulator